MAPAFGWELIRRGAAWRYCEPLHLKHGNSDTVKAATPAIVQVCAPEVVLVHKGETYRQSDVWFYLYEGALPDAMLSDNFLNSIPCISHPGKRLLDTKERATDRDILRQYLASAQDIVDYQLRKCQESNSNFSGGA